MSQASGVPALDPAAVKAMIDRGEALLIDVRERDEHARENIPGAILLPTSTFNPANVPPANGKQVVFHCTAGTRSDKAARATRDAGYSGQIFNLAGGINAWKKAGLPTYVNPKAPLPIMRQVQMIAGSLILLGVILGYTVAPGWFLLSGFVGAGLLLAGVTGWCGMATMLGKLPYNRA